MLKPINFDAYISSFPTATQALLKQIQTTVKKAAPQADEVISYGMPVFKQNGILLYFAACKNHIGFYPTASGIAAFQKELSIYKGAKVQFSFHSTNLFHWS